MLRADGLVCGTSTTGTGALTLAACPSPPGGLDFYVWLTATGLNFVNGNAILVSYTIIEYTDASFATAKSQEKGVGTLTLGASLTASTLARTTVQATATSLSTTGVPTYSSPTAFSIGTAANTLVMIGASTTDLAGSNPYYETTSGDNLGVMPLQATWGSGVAVSGANLVSGNDVYIRFKWDSNMLVKKASMRVQTAYSGTTGGSPVSTAYARIYDINSSGRPGKLLYDFGTFGTNPLNATGNISTGNSGNGFLMTPDEYFFDFYNTYSGATGTITSPAMRALNPATAGYLNSAKMGTSGLIPIASAIATGGSQPGPDPANLTGYTAGGGNNFQLAFALNVS